MRRFEAFLRNENGKRHKKKLPLAYERLHLLSEANPGRSEASDKWCH
jgi:hypothetical protein